MDNYLAVGIAEGFEEAESEEQLLEAWQYLVDTGLVWELQGSFGRTAITLLAAGHLTYKGDNQKIINDIQRAKGLV